MGSRGSTPKVQPYQAPAAASERSGVRAAVGKRKNPGTKAQGQTIDNIERPDRKL